MPMPGMPPLVEPVVVQQPTQPPPPPPTPSVAYIPPPVPTEPPYIQCFSSQECVPAHVCSGRFEPFDNSPNAVNQSIINYFLNHWLDSSYIHWLVDVVEMFNFRFSSWSLLQSTTSSNNTTTSSTDSTSRSSTSWLLPTSSSTATYATSFDSVPFNPWMYSSSYLRWPFRIVWW